MTEYKSMNANSTRSLLVDSSPLRKKAVRLSVNGTNRSGRSVYDAKVVLSDESSVALALDLLKRVGREDLLAQRQVIE